MIYLYDITSCLSLHLVQILSKNLLKVNLSSKVAPKKTGTKFASFEDNNSSMLMVYVKVYTHIIQ